MAAFKVGDTVRLKSGGPLMTVRNTGEIECTWFLKDQLKKGTFPADVLKKGEDGSGTLRIVDAGVPDPKKQ